MFERNPFSNKHLLGAVALSAGLSIGAIYLSVGNLVLGTAPLALSHLIPSGVRAVLGVRYV